MEERVIWLALYYIRFQSIILNSFIFVMKIFFMHKKCEHKHADTQENDTTDYSVYYIILLFRTNCLLLHCYHNYILHYIGIFGTYTSF